MMLGVGADGVAGVTHFAHHLRVGVRHLADDKEGRLDALRGEDIEDRFGVFRQRTVVEGQHHLMVIEWQRLRILHGADARMLGGIDHQRARGAERIGMAGAFGGMRERRGR